jgi:hypothetical protein
MDKEIKLPSGKVAIIGEFKGKHIREAQRIADGKQDMFLFALIAITGKIDGENVNAEDLDEMDGADVLALMSEFSGNFTLPAKQ